MEAKGNIRKEVFARRRAATQEEIQEKSRMIYEKITALPEFLDADCFFAYMDFKKEVMTRDLIEKALGHAFFFSMLHIQRIGCDNRFGVCHKVFRCFFQHTVFLLRLHDSKHRLRLAGSRSDFFQLHHTRLLLVLSYRNWLNGKSSALSPASAAEHPSLQTAPHQTAETQTPLQPL